MARRRALRRALAVVDEHLEAMLAGAEDGDVEDARDSLAVLVILLDTRYTHPDTGEPLQMPGFARDYLARAFDRIVEGEAADAALNLRRRTRVWRYPQKLMGAKIVADLIAQGKTVLEATNRASELVQRYDAEALAEGRYQLFGGRAVQPETLSTWYYNHRDELHLLPRA